MYKTVIESLETSDSDRCVDIFRRDDSTFGFEIYRRDAETLGGWFAIGGQIERIFKKETHARQAAALIAPWLDAEQT